MMRLIEFRQFSDGVLRSVLSEELLVCHRLIIELIVVVLWVVKKFTVGRVQFLIVL